MSRIDALWNRIMNALLDTPIKFKPLAQAIRILRERDESRADEVSRFLDEAGVP